MEQLLVDDDERGDGWRVTMAQFSWVIRREKRHGEYKRGTIIDGGGVGRGVASELLVDLSTDAPGTFSHPIYSRGKIRAL